MATFRKSTTVIVAVQSTNHENERRPSLEAQQAVGPQTEEKVLSQQAAMQEVPRRRAQGPQGRTERNPRQGSGQGVQTRAANVSLCSSFGHEFAHKRTFVTGTTAAASPGRRMAPRESPPRRYRWG